MNAGESWEVLTRALGQSDVVQKLGWMLLHSIWQGAAGACILWMFLFLTRGLRDRKWSSIRYTAACIAMLAVILAAAITFARSMRVVPAPARISTVLPANSIPDDISFLKTFDHPIHPPPAKFDPHSLIPITVYFWFIGVAIQSIWQSIGWMRLRRLRQGVAIIDPAWIEILHETSARLGIRRIVGLVVGAIDVPAVIGAFRPVIIIPLALVNELSPQQVQAILAHELAHIRRWDYAVNLVQTAVETLFFYHPAVWWISSQIRRERENCCDDIAANLCGDPRRYAGTLIKLEERRADSPRLSLAATDGSLIDRIRRLLAVPSPRTGRARSILVALVALICVLVPIGWQRTSHAQATKSAAAPATRPDDSRRQEPGRKLQIGDAVIVKNMNVRDLGVGQTVEIVRIDASGNITLKSLPPIHAVGLTQQEIHDAIVKAYVDAKMATSAEISITVDIRDSDAEYSDISNQMKRLQAQLDDLDAELSRQSLQGDDLKKTQIQEMALRQNLQVLEKMAEQFGTQTPSEPDTGIPSTQPANRRAHVIAVDDVILVSIMDLRGEGSGEDLEIAHVSDSGNISLPFIQPLHALGLTEEQLHDAIVKAYVDASMIRNPQVTVTLDTRMENGQSSAISEALKLAEIRIEAAKEKMAQAQLTALQQAQLAAEDKKLQEVIDRVRDLEIELKDRESTQGVVTPMADNPTFSPRDSAVSQDDLNLAYESQGKNSDLRRLLNDRKRMIDQLDQLKANGYGDNHATVKATRAQLADTDQRLKSYADDAKLSYQYVHVTIGKAGFISVDGGVGNWDTLRERLLKEPQDKRARVVIALAAESTDLPVGDFFQAQATAAKLISELGLAPLSVAGVETNSSSATTRTQSVVYIGGHARRSGLYSITDTHMTISQLLIAAGGVEGGDDSHAWVTLIRRVGGAKKEVMKDVPLFDIESGTSDQYLQPDDTVEISITEPPAATEPTGGVYYIGGHVLRAGVYSFVGQSRTLRQAIDDAGGLSANAPPDPWLEVIRRVDGVKQVFAKERIADIRKGGSFDLDIQADDTLEIGTNDSASTEPAKQTIKIQGNVRQPGEYSLEPNESVGDLIRYARGVRDMDADGVKVFLFRNKTVLALPPINDILSLPHGEILLESGDMLIVTDSPKTSDDNSSTQPSGVASAPTTKPSFDKVIKGSLFFIYGKFDLAQSGRPTDNDKPKIEELAIKSGGKVQSAIDADTDFVVIGTKPQLEAIPWEDREDPFKVKLQQDALREHEAYLNVLDTANQLHIPVMSQNQFLVLVKY